MPPSDYFLHHHYQCDGFQQNFFIDSEMRTTKMRNLDWQEAVDIFMEGFGETYRKGVHSLCELCKHYEDKGSQNTTVTHVEQPKEYQEADEMPIQLEEDEFEIEDDARNQETPNVDVR